jgi:hypothetical protein
MLECSMREKLKEVNQAAAAYVLAVLAMLPGDLDLSVRAEGRRLRGDARGQLGLGTILAAITVVIAVSLAVIIVDKFDQSLGDPSSSSLSTAQNDVLQGFADMTGLVGPLFLVAISVVIIGLIKRVSGA